MQAMTTDIYRLTDDRAASVLISINEAAEQGIERLRRTIWTMPEDHIKIDIVDGKPGIWTHLYSPLNKECNGRDPFDILCMQIDYGERVWVPYQGPLSDSEQYKAACVRADKLNRDHELS
jgi:hypothetical protein